MSSGRDSDGRHYQGNMRGHVLEDGSVEIRDDERVSAANAFERL